MNHDFDHGGEMNRRGKLRIILLNDDDVIREVMTELLTRRGYEVFSFSKPTICPLMNLPECRCYLNQSYADVILTDVDMPGMNGIQFIENLKQKNCKCQHVAVMSGCLSPGEALKAKQLGCSIFKKPFDTLKFLEWLDATQQFITPSRELCDWFQRTPQFA